MVTILSTVVGLAALFFLFSQIAKANTLRNPTKKGRLTAANDILLNAGYDIAMNKAKEAIKLFNLKLQRFDDANGILVALSGMDLRSLGEIITVSLKRDSNGTLINIQSRPAIPFSLVDYGRNKANVEALTKLIQN